MILFPAIDLKDGNCVRLLKGNIDEATLFNTSPANQATMFAESGCQWLHVVDLDGALAGASINEEAISSILGRVDVSVQLGGGIRDINSIERWIGRGVSRIILGTAALKNPDLVRESCYLFPGQIAVGVDARKGMVSTEGWVEDSDIRCEELAKRFEDCGVAAIIYTDIDRDGALSGLNIEATIEMARSTAIPIIASGGVSSIHDLRALRKKATPNIIGVVCGRALYDGTLNLEEGLNILK
ncbi:MAG: 1-(5-phosphoribosyl)-5-[(5-phosphoribosylamino)methylideneamino]imidazole-4-carboxamide isomerase [Rhodospirillaceae bacterium]|nr:1-(5-phosphoribosyl)-5-[(5-phosphoribosylamino)methylideneamino]imidazole-4-carboxamide isomerase [Rhodospirillaceae bacterium]|tara:strand:- start:73 stop:795 length:723 start_codon:yes stop_codon:yes gene_type:complete